MYQIFVYVWYVIQSNHQIIVIYTCSVLLNSGEVFEEVEPSQCGQAERSHQVDYKKHLGYIFWVFFISYICHWKYIIIYIHLIYVSFYIQFYELCISFRLQKNEDILFSILISFWLLRENNRLYFVFEYIKVILILNKKRLSINCKEKSYAKIDTSLVLYSFSYTFSLWYHEH